MKPKREKTAAKKLRTGAPTNGKTITVDLAEYPHLLKFARQAEIVGAPDPISVAVHGALMALESELEEA